MWESYGATIVSIGVFPSSNNTGFACCMLHASTARADDLCDLLPLHDLDLAGRIDRFLICHDLAHAVEWK